MVIEYTKIEQLTVSQLECFPLVTLNNLQLEYNGEVRNITEAYVGCKCTVDTNMFTIPSERGDPYVNGEAVDYISGMSPWEIFDTTGMQDSDNNFKLDMYKYNYPEVTDNLMNEEVLTLIRNEEVDFKVKKDSTGDLLYTFCQTAYIKGEFYLDIPATGVSNIMNVPVVVNTGYDYYTQSEIYVGKNGKSVTASYANDKTYYYFPVYADADMALNIADVSPLYGYTRAKFATLKAYNASLTDNKLTLYIGTCAYDSNAVLYFDSVYKQNSDGFYSPARYFGIGMNESTSFKVASNLGDNILRYDTYNAYVQFEGDPATYLMPTANSLLLDASFNNEGNKLHDYFVYARPSMLSGDNKVNLRMDASQLAVTLDPPDAEGRIRVKTGNSIQIYIDIPVNNTNANNKHTLTFIYDGGSFDKNISLTPYNNVNQFTYTYTAPDALGTLSYLFNITVPSKMYMHTKYSSSYTQQSNTDSITGIDEGANILKCVTEITYSLYANVPLLKAVFDSTDASSTPVPVYTRNFSVSNNEMNYIPYTTGVYQGEPVRYSINNGTFKYRDSDNIPVEVIDDVYIGTFGYMIYCSIPFVPYGILAYKVSSAQYRTISAELSTFFRPLGVYNGFNNGYLQVQALVKQAIASYMEPFEGRCSLSTLIESIANREHATWKCIDIDNRQSYDESAMQIIADVDKKNEFQFIKQQWETTDSVENYWFTDVQGAILELDQYAFKLKIKDSSWKDAWAGDKYKVVRQASRDYVYNIDGHKVVKYGVTNVYGISKKPNINNKAYLWIITHNDKASFNLYLLSIANDSTFMTVKCKKTFTVVHKEIDTDINNRLIPSNGSADSLYTYSTLNMSDMIFDAKYTATCIDNQVIFGVHVDNNMNQWAIKINMSSNAYTSQVIQGYGFVGMDGTLTGGEIPTDYFNSGYGFSGKVYPLSYLKDKYKAKGDDDNITDLNQLYTLDSICVGTESKQWYIQKELGSIVSHLTYDVSTQTFVAVPLFLNNNYDCCYGSTSVYSRFISDMQVKFKNMADIFTEFIQDNNTASSINDILTQSTLMPVLWALMPRINFFGYLQQTLGQYAYVHYNSTENYVQSEANDKNALEDMQVNMLENNQRVKIAPVASDELSFNTQVVHQAADPEIFTQLPWLLSICIASGGNLLDNIVGAAGNTLVNAIQGQQAVTDIGRKYEQQFLENVTASITDGMNIRSIIPSMTSTVTGKLTLDMFYSTSDKQQVHAGPGYVNHNFVSQCVAQSVTTNNVELNQITTRTFLRHLTFLIQDIEIVVLEQALYAAEQSLGVANAGQGKSGGIFSALLGSGSTAAAIAAVVVAIAAQVLLSTVKFFNSVCQGIFNALGGDRITTALTASMSKHNYDIEGKHKYGAKSESFMYPCWGVPAGQIYHNESVKATVQVKYWSLKQEVTTDGYRNNYFSRFATDDNNTWNLGVVEPKLPSGKSAVTNSIINDSDLIFNWHSDKVPYNVATCVSKEANEQNSNYKSRYLPDKMAYICGASNFLPDTPFRNENIDCGNPVFPMPLIHDYIIDESWQLSQTAVNGATTWITCKDTKLIDGEPSNIVIDAGFCGVASPYAAIEIKRGIDEQYRRIDLITPEVLAINNTGKNLIYNKKLYHGFDGIGYRYVSWHGAAGMNKEFLNYSYCFQVNDKLKRSNKLPANQVLGNFDCAPVVAVPIDVEDSLYNEVAMPAKGQNLEAGTIGEYRDVLRYSVPVFTEFVSTLPAAIKALSTYHLAVVDGVTSVCTDLRNTQSAYKAPESVDFIINKTTYRMTKEYICQVDSKSGAVVTSDVVPALGLTYLGSTPFEAYLYSPANRQYYTYSGGTALQVADDCSRFYSLFSGRYDFIGQEVVIKANNFIMYSNEKDVMGNNTLVVLKDGRAVRTIDDGEAHTYVSDASVNNYKIYSIPAGLLLQTPTGCVVTRYAYNADYMYDGIYNNLISDKINFEEYARGTYPGALPPGVQGYFGRKPTYSGAYGPVGWVYNPFVWYTMPLGIDVDTDCVFEWEITFDYNNALLTSLLTDKNYIEVYILAESESVSGRTVRGALGTSRGNNADIIGSYGDGQPMTVYIKLDTLSNNRLRGGYGYYSVKYTSNAGACNKQRLCIWSFAPIALVKVTCICKSITSNRQTKFVQEQDVQGLERL